MMVVSIIRMIDTEHLDSVHICATFGVNMRYPLTFT